MPLLNVIYAEEMPHPRHSLTQFVVFGMAPSDDDPARTCACACPTSHTPPPLQTTSIPPPHPLPFHLVRTLGFAASAATLTLLSAIHSSSLPPPPSTPTLLSIFLYIPHSLWRPPSSSSPTLHFHYLPVRRTIALFMPPPDLSARTHPPCLLKSSTHRSPCRFPFPSPSIVSPLRATTASPPPSNSRKTSLLHFPRATGSIIPPTGPPASPPVTF